MDSLIARLRAYRAHDATADALLDEAAAEVKRLRAVCSELVAAMVAYEVDVDTDAPQAHRDMMARAIHALAAAEADARADLGESV